jgi:type VI secretion system protein VasD
MNNKYFTLKFAGCLAALAMLSGCAAVGTVASVANAALEVTGLKKPDVPAIPELPDAQKPARTVQLNLHAADNLNTDPAGRPLALVARVYKLKQNAAFQQAPYDTFLNPQKEKELLGADLVEVKEVTLVPGQRYHADEKVSREAYFVGVVALFRAPVAQRWRATFPAADAEKTGITLGLHACALSVGTGALTTEDAASARALAPVHCG